MHTWASRLLKPKIQSWVFQALRSPDPTAIGKPSTPYMHRTLPELFGSPRSHTPHPPRPPPSASPSPPLVNTEAPPYGLEENQTTGRAQNVFPSIRRLARQIRHPVSPSARRKTASPLAQQTNPRSLAKNVLSINRPVRSSETPSNTAMDQYDSSQAKIPKDAHITEDIPNHQGEIDLLTKSLESSHLGDTTEEKPKHNTPIKSVKRNAPDLRSPGLKSPPRFEPTITMLRQAARFSMS